MGAEGEEAKFCQCLHSREAGTGAAGSKPERAGASSGGARRSLIVAARFLVTWSRGAAGGVEWEGEVGTVRTVTFLLEGQGHLKDAAFCREGRVGQCRTSMGAIPAGAARLLHAPLPLLLPSTWLLGRSPSGPALPCPAMAADWKCPVELVIIHQTLFFSGGTEDQLQAGQAHLCPLECRGSGSCGPYRETPVKLGSSLTFVGNQRWRN